VRFLAQFDALYARDWSAEQLLAVEAHVLPQALAPTLAALGRAGIADGSLHPDLDPELAVHSVLNAAIAVQRRLASLGGRVEEEYGIPTDVFDLAEYNKSITGGIEPDEFEALTRRVGFSQVETTYEWYAGQGKILHGVSAQAAATVDDYLR